MPEDRIIHLPGDRAGLWERSRGWLLKNLILPIGDAATRHHTIRRLRLLEKAQWWDAGRLRAERDRLLRETIRTAYAEVPLYRELMDRIGIGPRDIRTAADLPRLPLVSKPMLRDGYPLRVTRRTGLPVTEEHTSGSTGHPLAILEDRETFGWYRASFLLVLEWAGWHFGERQMQTGIFHEREGLRWVKDALFGCYYVSALQLDDRTLDAHLENLEKRKIRHLWGYPMVLHQLARRAEALGWNLPMRSIVTWGDQLYRAVRKQVEGVFRARILDTYGCSEGMQIAAQCGHSEGYHVHNLDVVVEYVDARGEPVEANQIGDIVLTRLHAGAMPFVRYMVGDRGIAGDQARCPCGRQSERIQALHGRAEDAILAPNGERFEVYFFNRVFDPILQIENFQAVQTGPESFTLYIQPGSGYTEALPEMLRRAFARCTAAGLEMRIEPVREIAAAPNGKYRLVVNRVLRPEERLAEAPWTS